MDQYNTPQQPQPAPQRKPQGPAQQNNRPLIIIIACLVVLLVGAGAWFAMSISSKNKAIEKERIAREQAQLDFEQYQMNAEFNDLNNQFMSLENQRIEVMNDSVKRELTEKYEAAKMQVEKLQRELKNQQNMSAAEIQKLKNEIATLRAILKDYVRQIDELNKENQALRTENQQLTDQNNRLTTQVQQTTAQNQRLNERMNLAEKLNVTGVNLIALNAKGKQEKKVNKAKQLDVTFTIPQNNSTPVGEKVIYLRIVSPSGQVLGGAGTFEFEGVNVEYTAKKTIEYGGEEIGGIHIYWDVNTALQAGNYTVELFTQGYRLTQRDFSLK